MVLLDTSVEDLLESQRFPTKDNEPFTVFKTIYALEVTAHE